MSDDVLGRIDRASPQNQAEALVAIRYLLRDAKQANQSSIGIPILEHVISRSLKRGGGW